MNGRIEACVLIAENQSHILQKDAKCVLLWGKIIPFMGRHTGPESLININLFKPGSVPFLKGKHHKPESNLKNRIAHQGENNSNWQGGKSFEPYTTEWNKQLKISIRDRDERTCQLCGVREETKAFPVHHIDYDKKNCLETNLITLCRRCHSKTNYNRSFWFQYFNYEKNKLFDNNRAIA